MKPLRSRFEKDTAKVVQNYTESISFDKRLYRQDITGSIAHAKMLASRSIIDWDDLEKIVAGLTSIKEEIERDEFTFDPSLEDIHMNIETRLFEKIGEVAGKLHTARSRNDQVATDIRLYAMDAMYETIALLRKFQNIILDLAEANKETIVPGYTHLQRAQPILLAHHLLAYFEMAQRDLGRFEDCIKRTDSMPLGSGALAGVPYPIDRRGVARELGFCEPSANSIDAVSDRDFIIEYHAAASIAMMHFSRLAEEIILWSSAEFGFVEIDDAFATSSSIMPQKKNPDVAELARGKTGRVYGNLISILVTMKGLPLAYNRDLQEDKEGFFDTVETLNSTIEVFAGMLESLTFNTEKMQQAASENYTLATDVADYLAKKRVPFREAHGIVGQLVLLAISKGKALHELPLTDYQNLSPLFKEDVFSITLESSVTARNVPGGTSPKQVERALKKARRKVNE
ncbi:MAG: argininosuccinate lyase [Chloroflexi bacterium]|jgi:argininosuccinate lyase|nr:argininosuccinate lyase [Chloroflexota bacterium]